MTASVKRAILLTLIVLLVISTLISIIAVMGEFTGETAGKLTGTASLIVFFTLTYLLAGMSFERRVLPSIGAIGLGASVLGFLYGLLLVLEIIKADSFGPAKPALVLAILAVGAGWISAVISVRGQDDRTRRVAWATAAAIGVLALVLIFLVFGESLPGVTEAKILTVLLSVSVLGSFLVPMLTKLGVLDSPPEASAAQGLSAAEPG